VDRLGGIRGRVIGDEILDFNSGFIFPLVVGTEIKESPAG
jgi:hypothetical protein